MNDLRNENRDFENMIPTAKRWPLLVTDPFDTWPSPQNNLVLMGDAAHSMVNT
jgi:salicylate hydroxylase